MSTDALTTEFFDNARRIEESGGQRNHCKYPSFLLGWRGNFGYNRRGLMMKMFLRNLEKNLDLVQR